MVKLSSLEQYLESIPHQTHHGSLAQSWVNAESVVGGPCWLGRLKAKLEAFKDGCDILGSWVQKLPDN